MIYLFSKFCEKNVRLIYEVIIYYAVHFYSVVIDGATELSYSLLSSMFFSVLPDLLF